MKKTVKIIVAHHNKILGQALVYLLSAQADFLVAGFAEDLSQAERLAAAVGADAIVSTDMPHSVLTKLGGLTVIPMGGSRRQTDRATRLPMDSDIKDLLGALRRIVNRFHKDGQTKSVTSQTNFASLTSREREIYELLAEGLTNQQIGKRLFITERTVKYHVSNVLRKLNVASRTEAVIKYIRAVE